MRIEYEAFKAGCTLREEERDPRSRGKESRRSERDTERRTEGARARGRERGGEGGRRKRIHPSVTLWQTARESQCEASLFSPSLFVLLSARPFVRLSACPSVRLFVCLLSLSPPAFRRLSHQKFISSPVLLRVLLLFLPCRRAGARARARRRTVPPACYYVLFYCQRMLLKFDPVTRPGGPRGIVAAD